MRKTTGSGRADPPRETSSSRSGGRRSAGLRRKSRSTGPPAGRGRAPASPRNGGSTQKPPAARIIGRAKRRSCPEALTGHVHLIAAGDDARLGDQILGGFHPPESDRRADGTALG